MSKFLTTEQVKEEQLKQLYLYGLGEPGIISHDRLDSAANAPQAGFGGEYFFKSPFEMAGAYLVRLAKAHAFGNANKRTSLGVALIYLSMNGFAVNCAEDDLINLVLDCATGNGDIDPATRFFEKHCQVKDKTGQSFEEAQPKVHQKFGSVFARLADM